MLGENEGNKLGCKAKLFRYSGIAIDQPPPNERLELYSDGFIMLGRFRSFSDPANKKLWETIKKGEVPDELRDRMLANPEGLVLSIIDKSKSAFEKSAEPPKKTTPSKFQGAGYTMASTSSPAGPTVKTIDGAAHVLTLNPNEAKVTLAFRLSNGKRISQDFNVSHSTDDVFRFIQSLAPQGPSFDLISGFPPRTIRGKPISELQNDLITQRPL